MKNFKNLILILVFSVCSLLLVGVSKVNAVVGFSTLPPVCSPGSSANDGLKAGDKTTCYIIGTGSQAQGKTHGFLARVYTTDGLLFDAASPYIANTNAASAIASAASDNQKMTLSFSDGTSKEYTCKYDTGIKADKEAWNIAEGDIFRCVLYYSNTTTPAITVQSAAPKSDIQNLVSSGGNGVMVIGTVAAHIDENSTAQSSCGEICVFVKEADTVESYAGLNEGMGNSNYACSEVHFTTNSVASDDTPVTGAFTSYAILAAGALIAISAVAIAKKHNKIYRV